MARIHVSTYPRIQVSTYPRIHVSTYPRCTRIHVSKYGLACVERFGTALVKLFRQLNLTATEPPALSHPPARAVIPLRLLHVVVSCIRLFGFTFSLRARPRLRRRGRRLHDWAGHVVPPSPEPLQTRRALRVQLTLITRRKSRFVHEGPPWSKKDEGGWVFRVEQEESEGVVGWRFDPPRWRMVRFVGVLCVSLAHPCQSRTGYGILARAASSCPSWGALARHSGFHRTARDALFQAAPPLADSLTSRR